MEPADALLSIAEIALGVAGFSGIFLALSRERGAPRQPSDTYRLVMLLGSSVGTLFLALVPVGLEALGVTAPALWRIAAALAALVMGGLIASALRWRRRFREQIREGETPGLAAVVATLAWLALAAQLATAAGLLGTRAFGAFLFGLIYLTTFGGYLFARMLFLWRS